MCANRPQVALALAALDRAERRSTWYGCGGVVDGGGQHAVGWERAEQERIRAISRINWKVDLVTEGRFIGSPHGPESRGGVGRAGAGGWGVPWRGRACKEDVWG